MMRLLSSAALVLIPLGLIALLVGVFVLPPSGGLPNTLLPAFVIAGIALLCVTGAQVLALISCVQTGRRDWLVKIIFFGGPFLILHYVNTAEGRRQ